MKELNKIEHPLMQETYNMLLKKHTKEESCTIILNSLKILGDRKVKVQDFLDETSVKRINSYRHQDRLSAFIRITSEKSDQWKKYSFSRIVLSS